MIYEGSVKGPHVLQPIVPVAMTMVTQPRPGRKIINIPKVHKSTHFT